MLWETKGVESPFWGVFHHPQQSKGGEAGQLGIDFGLGMNRVGPLFCGMNCLGSLERKLQSMGSHSLIPCPLNQQVKTSKQGSVC